MAWISNFCHFYKYKCVSVRDICLMFCNIYFTPACCIIYDYIYRHWCVLTQRSWMCVWCVFSHVLGQKRLNKQVKSIWCNIETNDQQKCALPKYMRWRHGLVISAIFLLEVIAYPCLWYIGDRWITLKKVQLWGASIFWLVLSWIKC